MLSFENKLEPFAVWNMSLLTPSVNCHIPHTIVRQKSCPGKQRQGNENFSHSAEWCPTVTGVNLLLNVMM